MNAAESTLSEVVEPTMRNAMKLAWDLLWGYHYTHVEDDDPSYDVKVCSNPRCVRSLAKLQAWEDVTP